LRAGTKYPSVCPIRGHKEVCNTGCRCRRLSRSLRPLLAPAAATQAERARRSPAPRASAIARFGDRVLRALRWRAKRTAADVSVRAASPRALGFRYWLRLGVGHSHHDDEHCDGAGALHCRDDVIIATTVLFSVVSMRSISCSIGRSSSSQHLWSPRSAARSSPPTTALTGQMFSEDPARLALL
jgi:hypothetical protein